MGPDSSQMIELKFCRLLQLQIPSSLPTAVQVLGIVVFFSLVCVIIAAAVYAGGVLPDTIPQLWSWLLFTIQIKG